MAGAPAPRAYSDSPRPTVGATLAIPKATASSPTPKR
jgi:hypothetical protein